MFRTLRRMPLLACARSAGNGFRLNERGRSMSDFPMTDRVQKLLDEGEEEEAKQLAAQLHNRWVQNAKAGKLMNLSDLLASAEALHIHDTTKHERKKAMTAKLK